MASHCCLCVVVFIGVVVRYQALFLFYFSRHWKLLLGDNSGRSSSLLIQKHLDKWANTSFGMGICDTRYSQVLNSLLAATSMSHFIQAFCNKPVIFTWCSTDEGVWHRASLQWLSSCWAWYNSDEDDTASNMWHIAICWPVSSSYVIHMQCRHEYVTHTFFWYKWRIQINVCAYFFPVWLSLFHTPTERVCSVGKRIRVPILILSPDRDEKTMTM